MKWKNTLTTLLFVLEGVLLLAQCTPSESPVCVDEVTSVQQLTDCIAAGDLSIKISSDLNITCNYNLSNTTIILDNKVDIRFFGIITVNNRTFFSSQSGNTSLQIGTTIFTKNGTPSFTELNAILALLIGNATLSDLFGILPVEFISFSGKAEQRKVALHWATATESNNKEFEVEHSLDGKEFKMIDVIQGMGTSYERQDYTYEHKNAASGLNYYRLRQVDFDGTYAYSEVISVQMSGTKPNYRLFPNPAKAEVTILTDRGEVPAQVRLYNSLGQEIKLNSSESGHYHLPRSLQRGTYIVKIEGNGMAHFERLLIQ